MVQCRGWRPGSFGAWEWRVTLANGIFNKIHHDIGTLLEEVMSVETDKV